MDIYKYVVKCYLTAQTLLFFKFQDFLRDYQKTKTSTFCVHVLIMVAGGPVVPSAHAFYCYSQV